MKLTGGRARGRRLRQPKTAGLRPTTARVREALFDVLGERVRGADFLDLFAGTGAVGIEALSRGACRAVFVENEKRAVRLIATNLALGSWQYHAELIAAPVAGALRSLASRGERFGIVFADPPYDLGAPQDLLLLASRVLAQGGVLVVEHRTPVGVQAPAAASLRPGRVYRYGDTALTVLHRDLPAGSP